MLAKNNNQSFLGTRTAVRRHLGWRWRL